MMATKMTNNEHNEQQWQEAFAAYLMKGGNEERAKEVLRIAHEFLPDFVRLNLDAGFTSLYAATDVERLKDYQDRIALDAVMKAEDRGMGDIGITATLIYYRRFLKSRFCPDHPAYVPPEPVPGEMDVVPNTEKAPELHEGAEVQTMHAQGYERNKEAREACISYFRKLHGGELVCECCGFNFAKAYKDIGEDYIEVHHRTPVSQRGGDYVVNPQTDLVPLCSNCHSMIHRLGGQGDCMTLDELKLLYTGKSYL